MRRIFKFQAAFRRCMPGTHALVISRKASTPTEKFNQARDSDKIFFMTWPKPPYKLG